MNELILVTESAAHKTTRMRKHWLKSDKTPSCALTVAGELHSLRPGEARSPPVNSRDPGATEEHTQAQQGVAQVMWAGAIQRFETEEQNVHICPPQLVFPGMKWHKAVHEIDQR